MKDLESLLKSFYLVSGMNMSIFDKDQNVIASYPKKKSPFCLLLDKNQEAKNQCIACDYRAMEHVKKSGEIYIYRCWCGLYEAIMPLYTYGQLTGYFMMGQTRAKDGDMLDILTKAKPYVQQDDTLENALNSISQHSRNQIKAFGELVDICASYLTLTNGIEGNVENLAEEIQRYLLIHYQEDISFDTLCNYFNVSKVTLHAHFKKTYHTTIHQRLMSIRLNEARKLLMTTQLSIKDVSQQVGFQDADYFSRSFKKVYHLSPTQVRNENYSALFKKAL